MAMGQKWSKMNQTFAPWWTAAAMKVDPPKEGTVDEWVLMRTHIINHLIPAFAKSDQERLYQNGGQHQPQDGCQATPGCSSSTRTVTLFEIIRNVSFF